MEVIVIILTLGWLIFWLLNFILNGRWWIWEFWSAVPGWFWGFSWLALLTATVVIQDWIGTLSLIYTIPFWWSALDINLWRKQKQASITGTSGVTLFNWNTEHWTEAGKVGFFEFLQKQDADIYHLQEAWSRQLVKFDGKADLQAYFPGYQIFQSTEMVTLTRLKVVEAKLDETKPFLRLDVEVNGKTVSFYNAHISVHFIPRYIVKGFHVKKFLSDMRRRFDVRIKEYALLNEALESNSNPFVLSGDFNTTTFMRAIRPLLNKYKDAYRSLKVGFATTWYGAFSLRWWRIDYVLGQKVNYLSYRIVNPGKLSDHWGQMAEITA